VTADRITHGTVSFEVARHCNLRCARCDRVSPWMPETFAAVEDFARDFDALSAVMDLDCLVFSGGEPLLHPRLVEFFRLTRERGYARGIVLLTNGVLLHRFTDEMWRLVDAVEITRYPGVHYKLDPNEVVDIGLRHDVTVAVKDTPVFPQSLLNDRIEDDGHVEAIFRGCSSSVNLHTVYAGRYFRCIRAHTFDERMERSGRPERNPEDGLDLHATRDLMPALAAYLGAERPLAACRYCLADIGHGFAHVQLRRREDIEREKTARHVDYRALIRPGAELDPSRVARPIPTPPGWWRYDGGSLYDLIVDDEAEPHATPVAPG